MTRFFKASLFSVLLITSTCPVWAQSVEDLQNRMNQMDEQMRQLVGQVEELTFTVKQLQSQVAASRHGEAAPSPASATGARRSYAVQEQPVREQVAVQERALGQGSSSGLERIDDVDSPSSDKPITNQPVSASVIGGLEASGLGTTKSAVPGDGGFQGKLLVAPGGENAAVSEETVALAEDGPEELYERANENLLRRQFSDAEQGFRTFVDRYPDHSLAGNAQYWLGETYYSRGDYRDAAKNFLFGYQKYPKGRRAPDSLLKLGMSLNKLGEKQKACESLSAVATEFPNAVDAKKRAQAEFRRSGC